jgi:hypothetical protein
MGNFAKAIKTGMTTALLVAGIATTGQAIVPGGAGSLGGEGRGLMFIKGSVVCSGCSLEQAREGQPDRRSLYQLSHKQGEVVMKITAVNDSARWSHLGQNRLWVRAKDTEFSKLEAEENLFKEVEITGLLNNTRTLDIFGVNIPG